MFLEMLTSPGLLRLAARTTVSRTLGHPQVCSPDDDSPLSASLEAPRRVHAYGIDAGRPAMTRNLRDSSVNCTLGTRPGRSRGSRQRRPSKGTAVAHLDRIAQPWGTRTPFGRDGQWPTRQDTFLADGVRSDDVDRWVQSASVLHSNGDAMDIAVKDGRIVGVRGRTSDRVNHGRLDPKDLYGGRPTTRASGSRGPSFGWTAGSSRATGTPPWVSSWSGRRRCWRSGARGRWASTRPGSSSWRSTTPSRRSCAAAFPRRTSTGTPGCARRPQVRR